MQVPPAAQETTATGAGAGAVRGVSLTAGVAGEYDQELVPAV
jgi:hypothetical protein